MPPKAVEHATTINAFMNLELPIREIRRAARLAVEQLHRAVLDDGTGEFTDDHELAVHAADQVLALAHQLESHWLQLHGDSRSG